MQLLVQRDIEINSYESLFIFEIKIVYSFHMLCKWKTNILKKIGLIALGNSIIETF